MALQPWRKGTVIKIDDHTHNTRRFWIQVPELEVIQELDLEVIQELDLDLDLEEAKAVL